jgi:8-oxo-dGTP pyrophosphatase MutT (NUDIX family)
MNSYCNNCGKTGHLFHQCKLPIISYGIIAFRENPESKQREYLLIRRKDTLGFVDFMRGKYSIYNKEYILNMIKQMTNTEKQRLLNDSFSKLWGDLWGTPPGLTTRANDPYKVEEQSSRNKFESLRSGVYTKMDSHNLEELVNLVDSNWTEPEWGFPKGRRNYQERDYDCAVREFCEETGYGMDQLVLLKNIQPFEETFTGSNYKSYKHKYYVTYIKYKDTLSYRHLQTSEVSGSSWMSAEMCDAAIRTYNVEKRRILESVEKMLNSNTLSYMS